MRLTEKTIVCICTYDMALLTAVVFALTIAILFISSFMGCAFIVQYTFIADEILVI